MGALQELFEIYLEQEKLPDLERALRSALEVNPGSVPLRNWLAWVRDADGDPSEAEKLFRAALADEPDHLETLVNLGSLLIDVDRLEEAVTLLRRALELEPERWQSHVNLIIALGKLGRLGEVRAVFGI